MPCNDNTILFGNDWVTFFFLRKFNFDKFTTNINLAIKYDNIILAYDCYQKKAVSFDNIVKKILKKKKYSLGKNIFIYQMFC